MYKYILNSGTVTIKTPKVDNFSDIKITSTQYSDRIEKHSVYPNGLILDIIQYSDHVEYISNKKLIVLEDLSIAFED